MKKKVIIRAPLLSLSGYGTHSRQIFRWLLTRDDLDVYTQPVPWGRTSWMVNPDMEGGLVGEIMKRTTQKSEADISFQVQLPNEWDPNLAKTNIGVSAYVETDVCNSSWVNDNSNFMDMIIVPSNHVKQTIENSGVHRVPIKVIPESFYDCILKETPDLPLSLDTDFNFLILGQLTGQNPENDRKNVFYTVKWLCEVFADDPNVGIIVKSNSGSNSRIDRGITHSVFEKLVGDVRKGPYPKIHFLHGELTHEEICGLYRHPKVKALLSLTRGEGYGLPLLEAAACDLPVIATNWSGHLDFLNNGKWLKVESTLQTVHGSRIDGQIFVPGSKWACPDEIDAKNKIIKFRKSSTIPKKWAVDLGEKLREKYSQSAVSDLYDKELSEILRR
tara:strand:+ start:157 stop:1320 length:1164 start_codon:yes stop_codon:yes gene_type:complete